MRGGRAESEHAAGRVYLDGDRIMVAWSTGESVPLVESEAPRMAECWRGKCGGERCRCLMGLQAIIGLEAPAGWHAAKRERYAAAVDALLLAGGDATAALLACGEDYEMLDRVQVDAAGVEVRAIVRERLARRKRGAA